MFGLKRSVAATTYLKYSSLSGIIPLIERFPAVFLFVLDDTTIFKQKVNLLCDCNVIERLVYFGIPKYKLMPCVNLASDTCSAFPVTKDFLLPKTDNWRNF